MKKQFDKHILHGIVLALTGDKVFQATKNKEKEK
jgi:hypothetical protein